MSYTYIYTFAFLPNLLLVAANGKFQHCGLGNKLASAAPKRQTIIAVPGFEPGLPDSESGVLTTTLYRNLDDNPLRSE